MNLLLIADGAQIIIAVSVLYVWIVRFNNIVNEFIEYGIPDLLRNLVGATKIALSTLLLTGLWYPALVLVPALLMAGLMGCAQIAHLRATHPWPKFVPSAIFLLLSLLVAGIRAGLI